MLALFTLRRFIGACVIMVLAATLIGTGYFVGRQKSDPINVPGMEAAAIHQARKGLGEMQDKLKKMEADYAKAYGDGALKALAHAAEKSVEKVEKVLSDTEKKAAADAQAKEIEAAVARVLADVQAKKAQAEEAAKSGVETASTRRWYYLWLM